MSALEEAEFQFQCARLDYLLQERRRRLEHEADVRAQAELERVPMFLRRQAE
jgi:hypothetical protein